MKNVIIHLDQGFHYTTPLYVNKLKELEVIQSISRHGNCFDNSKNGNFRWSF